MPTPIKGKSNLEAYNLYLKGRYYWAQRPQGIGKAIDYFRQAIDNEPGYARARAGLADCYVTLGSWENGSPVPACFDLNPNYAVCHHWWSHYLTAVGKSR